MTLPTVYLLTTCFCVLTTLLLTPAVSAECPSLDPSCSGLMCLYGRAFDSDWCLLCDCANPCEDVTCGPDERCSPTRIPDCDGERCLMYNGTCVSTGTSAPCPELNCTSAAPCRFGKKFDRNGCPTCECYQPCDPDLATCPPGQRCFLTSDDCQPGDECRDGPTPYCAECPNLECNGSTCQYGRTVDGYRCTTCDCLQPCQGVTCEMGEQCVPTRIPGCNGVRCEMYNGTCSGPVYSTECSLTVLNQCNKSQPSLPMNMTRDIASFCRLNDMFRACVVAMNCTNNPDTTLYALRQRTLRQAESNRYLCTSARQVVLQSWHCAVTTNVLSESSCNVNSTLPSSLVGLKIGEICRIYNQLYLCQFESIQSACGTEISRIYMTHNIPLWQPSWISVYCSIDIPNCVQCSTNCTYGYERTLYDCDRCSKCFDPCQGVNCPVGESCRPSKCAPSDSNCTNGFQPTCRDLSTSPSTQIPTTTSPVYTTVSPPVVEQLPSNFSYSVHTAVVCEGSAAELQCPSAYVVVVTNAKWGRFDSRTCPSSYSATALDIRVSSSLNTTETLRQMCTSQATCEVNADVKTFGEPRRAETMTPIYLAVGYTCQLPVYSSVQCEGIVPMVLSCPGSRRLDIRSAIFGRMAETVVCPRNGSAAGNCSTRTATVIVQTLCNGKSECVISANSTVFGDPCPADVRKYLEVEYTCAECNNAHGNDFECLYLANIGLCYNNPSFMLTYCRKACTRCGENIPDCVSRPPSASYNCTQLAEQGQCQTDPRFMYAYCRQDCLDCRPKTRCVNKYAPSTSACGALWATSNCTTNPNWMLANCTKSCFSCIDYIKCENVYNPETPQCDEWALAEECFRNPGFMMAYCTKSCLACDRTDPVCVNVADDDSCEDLARRGDCSTNPVWMFRNCWKSCLQCTGARKCANAPGKDAWCEAKANQGLCDSTLLSTCYLSCTRCGPVPPYDDCINIDDDASCEYWASGNECDKNPMYMFINCRKTCSRCATFPSLIGDAALPAGGSDVADMVTSGSIVIMPVTFPQTGQLLHFSVYFTDTKPVHLQIWRQFPTNFTLIYGMKVVPSYVNKPQTVTVDRCLQVGTSDHVGFTSFDGPSPIASRYSIAHLDETTYVSLAVAVDRNFRSLNIPYSFSLSAGYFANATCR